MIDASRHHGSELEEHPGGLLWVSAPVHRLRRAAEPAGESAPAQLTLSGLHTLWPLSLRVVRGSHWSNFYVVSKLALIGKYNLAFSKLKLQHL